MKMISIKKCLVLPAVIAVGLAGESAQAQFQNTFDNASSFTSIRNYNPPPIWIGHDYGNDTANSVSWSSLDAAGNPGSGSVQISWTWNYTANGTGSAAFSMDLLPSPGQSYVGGTLSFDLYLSPSSTPGGYNDYGYFQVVARNTDGYNFDDTGVGNGLINFAGGSVGVWNHVSIPLNATTGNLIRALTIQDYNDAGRSINGSETINIDNLTLTAAPEPSSFVLSGLGAALLMFIRRRK